ncbi:hypothetical protein FOA52_002834 [Chlamydomonas sp. UWO 241]|nr:hypothetical protein FOA52_002834 [Chlamydomonas sp. UWO 241]
MHVAVRVLRLVPAPHCVQGGGGGGGDGDGGGGDVTSLLVIVHWAPLSTIEEGVKSDSLVDTGSEGQKDTQHRPTD